MMIYPKHWPPHYNASSSPCDMIDGPCCCGAWHFVFDFQRMIVEYGLEDDIILKDLRKFRAELNKGPPFKVNTVEENQKIRTDNNLRNVFR